VFEDPIIGICWEVALRQPTNSIVEGTPKLEIPYFKQHKNLRTRIIYGGLRPMVHKH
jgi:hypothetical protein